MARRRLSREEAIRIVRQRRGPVKTTQQFNEEFEPQRLRNLKIASLQEEQKQYDAAAAQAKKDYTIGGVLKKTVGDLGKGIASMAARTAATAGDTNVNLQDRMSDAVLAPFLPDNWKRGLKNYREKSKNNIRNIKVNDQPTGNYFKDLYEGVKSEIKQVPDKNARQRAASLAEVAIAVPTGGLVTGVVAKGAKGGLNAIGAARGAKAAKTIADTKKATDYARAVQTAKNISTLKNTRPVSKYIRGVGADAAQGVVGALSEKDVSLKSLVEGAAFGAAGGGALRLPGLARTSKRVAAAKSGDMGRMDPNFSKYFATEPKSKVSVEAFKPKQITANRFSPNNAKMGKIYTVDIGNGPEALKLQRVTEPPSVTKAKKVNANSKLPEISLDTPYSKGKKNKLPTIQYGDDGVRIVPEKTPNIALPKNVKLSKSKPLYNVVDNQGNSFQLEASELGKKKLKKGEKVSIKLPGMDLKKNFLAKEAKKYKSADDFARNNDLIFQGVGRGKQSDYLTTSIEEANDYARQVGLKGTGEIRVYKYSDLPDYMKEITPDDYKLYEFVSENFGEKYLNRPLTKKEYSEIQTAIGFDRNEIAKLPSTTIPVDNSGNKRELYNFWDDTNKAQEFTVESIILPNNLKTQKKAPLMEDPNLPDIQYDGRFPVNNEITYDTKAAQKIDTEAPQRIYTFKDKFGNEVDVPEMDLMKGSYPEVKQSSSSTGNRVMAAEMTIPGVTKIDAATGLPRTNVDRDLPPIDNTQEFASAESKKNRAIYGDDSSNFLDQFKDNAGRARQSGFTNITRELTDNINRAIGIGARSSNPLIRVPSRVAQGLYSNVGRTWDEVSRKKEYAGQTAYSYTAEGKLREELTPLLGKNKEEIIPALKRVNDALKAGDFSKLAPNEKEVAQRLRDVLDYIHEASYNSTLQGGVGINRNVYVANKGKYVPKMYENYELVPAEMLDEQTKKQLKTVSGKVETGMFKARKDNPTVSSKTGEALVEFEDPIATTGKILRQIEHNKAIQSYARDIAKIAPDKIVDPNVVPKSQIPKGYFKFSDSKAYGPLAGKYVDQNIAEDFRGYFVSNAIADTFYDVIKSIGNNPLVKADAQLKTVFNVSTQLSNKANGWVMSNLTGANPARVMLMEASSRKEITSQGKWYRAAQKMGIFGQPLGLEDTRTANRSLRGLDDATGRFSAATNLAKRGYDRVKREYQLSDDVVKMSVFRDLIENRKFTPEEARRRVLEGLQDYTSVGRYWDIVAKVPFVGERFIKFQGDLNRLGLNAVKNSPLGLASMIGMMAFFNSQSSQMSGETADEKKLREDRIGSRAIRIGPFSVPLNVMIGDTEFDVARLVSPYFQVTNPTVGSPDAVSGAISQFTPFKVADITAPLRDSRIPDSEKGRTVLNQVIGSQPLSSPYVNLLLDQDFRGKSVSNPDYISDKEISQKERSDNRWAFLRNSVTPPTANQLWNVYLASQGKEDFYGNVKTVPEAAARLGAIRTTDMSRDKKIELAQTVSDSYDRRIEAIKSNIKSASRSNEERAKRGKTEQGRAPVDENTQAMRVAELERKLQELEQQRQPYVDFLSKIKIPGR